MFGNLAFKWCLRGSLGAGTDASALAAKRIFKMRYRFSFVYLAMEWPGMGKLLKNGAKGRTSAARISRESLRLLKSKDSDLNR